MDLCRVTCHTTWVAKNCWNGVEESIFSQSLAHPPKVGTSLPWSGRGSPSFPVIATVSGVEDMACMVAILRLQHLAQIVIQGAMRTDDSIPRTDNNFDSSNDIDIIMNCWIYWKLSSTVEIKHHIFWAESQPFVQEDHVRELGRIWWDRWKLLLIGFCLGLSLWFTTALPLPSHRGRDTKEAHLACTGSQVHQRRWQDMKYWSQSKLYTYM